MKRPALPAAHLHAPAAHLPAPAAHLPAPAAHLPAPAAHLPAPAARLPALTAVALAAVALTFAACPDFPEDMCQLDGDCETGFCDPTTARCGIRDGADGGGLTDAGPGDDGGTTADAGPGDDGGTTTDAGPGGDGGTTTGPEDAAHAGTCSDAEDNDDDGFSDCFDPGCFDDEACPLTIRAIRDPDSIRRPALGASVELSDVVVTAVRVTPGLALPTEAHVQMPGGGPYSAIVLMTSESLGVGDVLDLEGTFTDVFGYDTIDATNVSVITSGGTVPAAEVLDPSELVTGSTTADQWESVLVEVRSVAVSDEVVEDAGEEYGAFRIDDGLIVGRAYGHHYYDALQTLGDAFQSITGVMQLGFDEYRLEPRDDADLVFAGGSDASPTELGLGALREPEHAEHPATGTLVRVTGAAVTATKSANERVFLFTAQDAEAGIWVEVADGVDPGAVEPGVVVDLIGVYDEPNGQAEITIYDAPVLGEPTVPSPVVVPEASELVGASAERHEGMLVTLAPQTGLTVASEPDAAGRFVVNGVTVDDVFFAYPAVMDEVLASITGVVSQAPDGVYVLCPRVRGDVGS